MIFPLFVGVFLEGFFWLLSSFHIFSPSTRILISEIPWKKNPTQVREWWSIWWRCWYHVNQHNCCELLDCYATFLKWWHIFYEWKISRVTNKYTNRGAENFSRIIITLLAGMRTYMNVKWTEIPTKMFLMIICDSPAA